MAILTHFHSDSVVTCAASVKSCQTAEDIGDIIIYKEIMKLKLVSVDNVCEVMSLLIIYDMCVTRN